jgi:hypothetical protein
VNEIDVMIDLVQKIELKFQRWFDSQLYSEMARTRDSELRDNFNRLAISTEVSLNDGFLLMIQGRFQQLAGRDNRTWYKIPTYL